MDLNINEPASRDIFLTKSKVLINEIKLTTTNAVDINGTELNGTFTVGEQSYNYFISKIPSPFIEDDLILNGEIYNIGFLNIKDSRENIDSYEYKEGKENIIKIYSTMFKIILNFVENIKPDYFVIASLDSTRYFPIYSNLTKNNKIPGYHRKTIVNLKNYSDYPMTGIMMTKDTNISENSQFGDDFKRFFNKI